MLTERKHLAVKATNNTDSSMRWLARLTMTVCSMIFNAQRCHAERSEASHRTDHDSIGMLRYHGHHIVMVNLKEAKARATHDNSDD
jgi:hypothetical protein